MSYKSFSRLHLRNTIAPCVLSAIIFLAPPTAIAGDDHDDHEESSEQHDLVTLSSTELAEFSIVLSTAGSGVLRKEITVLGEVVVNYDRLSHITPRFSGVVKKVNKHLGDRVEVGEVLAVIESNESLVDYEIKSLMDGVVIEKHITIGEVRSTEGPVFVVADLDTVWVNLTIYQMHLSHIKVGQQVTISAGQEFANTTGYIYYLSPIVDEHTRTTTARIVIANSERNWRPGLFVEGKVVASVDSADLVVPKSSIQQFEGADVVFVRTTAGFVPIPVKIGRRDLTSVEILSGLKTGQEYVSQGGFTLKAELEKSSLSGGHSH